MSVEPVRLRFLFIRIQHKTVSHMTMAIQWQSFGMVENKMRVKLSIAPSYDNSSPYIN